MKGCPARQILGVNFGRGKIHALLSLFASMSLPSEWPSTFLSGRFWIVRIQAAGTLLRALITIEDEDGAVVAWDFDRLAGGGALVEQIATWLPIVGRNPFADGLPGRLDGLEGFDVEGWVGWWREVDDALMSLSLHPSGCLAAVYLRCAPVPIIRGGGGRIGFRRGGRKCPRLSSWPGSRGTGAGRRPRRGG